MEELLRQLVKNGPQRYFHISCGHGKRVGSVMPLPVWHSGEDMRRRVRFAFIFWVFYLLFKGLATSYFL